MNQWILLAGAIVCETAASIALKASDGFSRLWPSLIVVSGYGASFFLLALTLRTMPVGIAYAIWAAVGISLITLLAWLVYGQTLSWPQLAGLILIVAGVVLLTVFTAPGHH